MTTGCKQFSLAGELPSYTDERPLSFGNLMRGADLEHLIKDLQQVIQVKPLENDLLRSAKASTCFIVSVFNINSRVLTWINWEPILHMPLELLMNALEQRHPRFDRNVFLDGSELNPKQIRRCRAAISYIYIGEVLTPCCKRV